MVTYTTATDVANLLQIADFTVSTSPTLAQVEKIIERKENYIDQKLNHAWRTATSKSMFIDLSYVDVRNGGRFDLPNYSINTITKLDVWDGVKYVDYLTNATEGRDADFWIDKNLGVLYIKKQLPLITRKPIEIQYTYGESSVDLVIEDLATHLAAIDVINMFPKRVRFADDGGTSTQNQTQRITDLKANVNAIFNSLSNIGTI